MSTIKKSRSLADKVADILKPNADNFDDDSFVDHTNAKVVEATDVDEDEIEEQFISKFRRTNVDFLADLDDRYAGEKKSRKPDDSEDEELSSDDEFDSQKGVSENEVSSVSDEEDYFSGENGEIEGEETENNEDSFRHIKETSLSSNIMKGRCVRNQINMWENLLELRIQLQKCLVGGNKIPSKEYFNEIKKQSGIEFTSKVNETKHSLCDVLDKLLELQSVVLKKFPETTNLNKCDNTRHSDEEIQSNTEDEMEMFDKDDEDIQPQKKRLKLSDYSKEISARHEQYKEYRNNIIEKWNSKTRIAIMSNKLMSHSLISQIEHNLLDTDKLTKRTQLKRSEYHIVGHEKQNVDVQTEEYNTEIFDDDDFYHQLLRELIEVKSVNITDPVQLGRQWIQLQNMRSKMKRKIDTRATKGRKIRYTVHSKLVNFMAPVGDNQWTDEAKTELYNSLFDKK